MGRACGNGRLRRGGGLCWLPGTAAGKGDDPHGLPFEAGQAGAEGDGRLRQGAAGFVGRFLEKDPDSPSGYALRTGETGRKAAAYQAIEDHVVGGYKKVETALQTLFWKKQTLRPRRRRGNSKQEGKS